MWLVFESMYAMFVVRRMNFHEHLFSFRALHTHRATRRCSNNEKCHTNFFKRFFSCSFRARFVSYCLWLSALERSYVCSCACMLVCMRFFAFLLVFVCAVCAFLLVRLQFTQRFVLVFADFALNVCIYIRLGRMPFLCYDVDEQQ